MAKGALAAGYASQGQTGGRRGSGSTPGFADIAFRAGDIAERKKIREQDAQDKFTQARKDFEKEQQDLYGALAYEDQFDDTGITDVDAAGQKLANVLKSEFEMTQQLYRMGKIDENEVRRRNTRMKGQIGNLKSGVFEKISSFKAELDKKIQAGTDSEADHMKLRQLEDMTENVAFGVDANGNVEIRTPGTGEVAMEIGEGMTKREARRNVDMSKATRIPMSKLSSLLQNEPGADLNSMTDRIRGLEKAGDIYRAGSREYTRYTQPDGEGGRKLSPDQEELMSIAIKGLSPTEKLDALKKLNADFDELGITDNDVLGYEDKPEKVKAIDDALKEGLNNKLMNELRAMESSKPYDDPVERVKAVKEATKELPTYERVVMNRDKTAPMRNDGFNDTLQIGPRKGQTLTMSSLGLGDVETNRLLKRASFQGADGSSISGLPPLNDPAMIEAVKNGTMINAEMPWNSSKKQRGDWKEADFTFEIQVPDPEAAQTGDPMVASYAKGASQVPMKTIQFKVKAAGYQEYNNWISMTGREDLMVGTSREGAQEIATRSQRGAQFNND